MSVHAPRPDGDPDKALCGVMLSRAMSGNPRSFAKTPKAIDKCDGCVLRLVGLWRQRGFSPAAIPFVDVWPWDYSVPQAGKSAGVNNDREDTP